MTRSRRGDWGRAIAKIFPGDVIHAVAPISAPDAPSSVRIAAIDDARLARMRKLARRAARSGSKS